ncbi:MAG TPA: UDP-N-acetylmuramoyl-tripeptide--D-alanyl-D-alanine ligase [Phycisphaerae bacterium]|nr:UDP-N-acetylmuramoyl-tripeptide--D-alanyl-D-alanine ligase [Phycisphaerae bacterium]
MIAMHLDEVAAAMGATSSAAPGNPLVTGVSIDSRTVQPGELFFAVRGDRFDGHDYLDQAASAGAVACVVSRRETNAPIPCLGVADTVAALGRFAAYHRTRIPATVIAVTGSNGKTTTKRMIDHVLGQRLRGRAAPKSFNNNLGVPLTLLSADRDDQYLVVEIGSNAPGEVGALAAVASPQIGVVTSVGFAHLEGLGGVAGVVREKLSLLLYVDPAGLGVVNVDRPEVRALLRYPTRPELVTFGVSDAADLCITEARGGLDGLQFRINGDAQRSLAVCGTHNALNATAAFAVARRMGLDDDDIAAGLASFQPADMRLNVMRLGQVTVINDCYNANPSSMAAAIDVLTAAPAGRRVLALGDMLELGAETRQWHERIGRQAGEAGVDLLLAVGPHASVVITGARQAGPDIQTLVYDDAEQAGAAVGDWARPGDVVLVKGSRAMAMERVVEALRQYTLADAPAA